MFELLYLKGHTKPINTFKDYHLRLSISFNKILGLRYHTGVAEKQCNILIFNPKSCSHFQLVKGRKFNCLNSSIHFTICTIEVPSTSPHSTPHYSDHWLNRPVVDLVIFLLHFTTNKLLINKEAGQKYLLKIAAPKREMDTLYIPLASKCFGHFSERQN